MREVHLSPVISCNQSNTQMIRLIKNVFVSDVSIQIPAASFFVLPSERAYHLAFRQVQILVSNHSYGYDNGYFSSQDLPWVLITGTISDLQQSTFRVSR